MLVARFFIVLHFFLNVVMLNVIMLSVVVPFNYIGPNRTTTLLATNYEKINFER